MVAWSISCCSRWPGSFQSPGAKPERVSRNPKMHTCSIRVPFSWVAWPTTRPTSFNAICTTTFYMFLIPITKISNTPSLAMFFFFPVGGEEWGRKAPPKNLGYATAITSDQVQCSIRWFFRENRSGNISFRSYSKNVSYLTIDPEVRPCNLNPLSHLSSWIS